VVKFSVPRRRQFGDVARRDGTHRLMPSQERTRVHSRHGLRGCGWWTWNAGPRHALGGDGIDGTILVIGRDGGFWRMAFHSPR